jgi:hypothetical protein
MGWRDKIRGVRYQKADEVRYDQAIRSAERPITARDRIRDAVERARGGYDNLREHYDEYEERKIRAAEEKVRRLRAMRRLAQEEGRTREDRFRHMEDNPLMRGYGGGMERGVSRHGARRPTHRDYSPLERSAAREGINQHPLVRGGKSWWEH